MISWLISIGFVWHFFDDRLARDRLLFRSIRGEPGALRTVKPSPAHITWLFRKTCTTLRSGGLISACQRTLAPRRPSAWATRGPESLSRIFKDHPHYPDILSLRQGCPSLASYYGTCSFLDGMSAIVVGSLCRNQAEEHMPSQPLPRCSMRLLFSSIHCYLDPSSVRLLTLPTKVPSDSLGRIGSLKRTSDKSLFPMALGSCGHRITHQLRPINMNGRSILSVTSSLVSVLISLK